LPLLEPGKTLRFVFLPEGQDPDDLLRDQGPDALKTAIDEARPLIDVLWEREKALEPLDDPDRRAGFRKRIRQLVAKIDDGDVKAEYRAEFDRRIDALFQTAKTSPRRAGGNWRPGASRFGPPPGPSGALKQARKGDRAHPMARQLLIACIEFPEIAEAETETLAEMGFGPLDSLRDAILDACLSGEVWPDGGLRDALRQRGFGPELARLSPDRAPMRASLGGEDADAQSRVEAWRRLSASYMERVAHDARIAEERARQADVFEQGDPQAFQTFLAAVRRDRKR
jgi:DNA primase